MNIQPKKVCFIVSVFSLTFLGGCAAGGRLAAKHVDDIGRAAARSLDDVGSNAAKTLDDVGRATAHTLDSNWVFDAQQSAEQAASQKIRSLSDATIDGICLAVQVTASQGYGEVYTAAYEAAQKEVPALTNENIPDIENIAVQTTDQLVAEVCKELF